MVYRGMDMTAICAFPIARLAALNALRLSLRFAGICALGVFAPGGPAIADQPSQQLISQQLLNERAAHSFVTVGKDALAASQYVAAQTAFENAVVADPMSAEAYTYLARAEQQQNQFAAARWHYEIALRLDPDHVEALSWAGELDIKLDANSEAASRKLARLERVCGAQCPQYQLLAEALAGSTGKIDKAK
jgi:tetratricopeptide (TPR) repeat protein